MKILDKEQRKVLRDLFKSNLLKVSSLPRSLYGIIMFELDRSISEMDRLIGSTPATRGMARKCAVCGVLTKRGIYFNGTKRWLCIECGTLRQEKAQESERPEQPVLEGG
jgi:hypothetical protein